ncbi:MAG: hypothetical protein J5623_07955 [Clostridiales bacterium]|nr:hypothetical protein [Clostridiales bacterium]
MLYVLTALKCEAAALEGLPGKHIVTGVGKNACKALEKIELESTDGVINVGVAAGASDGCYLASSVANMETGRRFYPDMPSGIFLPELPLLTSPEIVTHIEPGFLYDMEAALVLEYAMKKVAPSRIAIVKVVSDDGRRRPSANEVTALIRSYRDEIAKIMAVIENAPEKKDYMPLDPSVMDELRLTQYMRCEFEDLVHYCVVSNKMEKLEGILEEMRRSGVLPVSDKRQGRRVLDEIFARIR